MDGRGYLEIIQDFKSSNAARMMIADTPDLSNSLNVVKTKNMLGTCMGALSNIH